ncbi:oligosaccharide repeat unit polymerase [Fictibacillus sp. 23RED33]|jgi:oligosaccharide repeat unit polymerase|uniref:oligosaccharide repeat unit polymerase n=1 Tax=Fictibacillus sp. 23RED33 TaxID=2745879 RepID=UPI0018CDC366|nr:oligosaccharide repeat unit polymerase [Fictibacillus sp. 23RED33]MBH0173803.1 oligosaccharide repeat unit polymerase [Fictibacillus sp. 23RED33]
MLFVLIWIAVLAASIMFFKYAAGTLSILKPNMLSISFYYSLLVSSFIGSIFIVTDTDHYYMIRKIKDEEVRIIGFFIICAVMFFLPLIMSIVSRLAGFKAEKEFENYLNAPVVLPFEGRKNEFTLLFSALSFICLLAVAYTMLKLDKIPLLELLKGSSNLGELRIEASRGFKGNVFIRNIFAIALTPVLSLVAYIYYVRTRAPHWHLLFLALFGASILIMTYDLAKSPVFFYFISFILLKIYVGTLRFNWKRVFLYGFLGSSLLILMYVFIQGANSLDAFLGYNKGPIGRLIFAQISPTYMHLDYFGDVVPYLYGQSFPGIISDLYNMDQVRSGRIAMMHFFPAKIEDGTGGVLNTLFVAEAFANYSYLGVFLSILYVGVLIQVLYICFLRLPKNPVFLSLFIYFTINIPRTLVGGFVDFIVNPIWLIVTAALLGSLFVVRLRLEATAFMKRKGEIGR